MHNVLFKQQEDKEEKKNKGMTIKSGNVTEVFRFASSTYFKSGKLMQRSGLFLMYASELWLDQMFPVTIGWL